MNPFTNVGRRKLLASISSVIVAGFAVPQRVRGAAPAAGGSDGGRSLEERLQLVEDLEQIRNLVADHGRYLDSGNTSAFLEQWTAVEPLWQGPFGVLRSREEIRDAMASYASNPRLSSPSVLHFMSGLHIEVNGDRAQATSRWAVARQDKEQHAEVESIGIYEDAFVREAHGWKFKRRVIAGAPSRPTPADNARPVR